MIFLVQFEINKHLQIFRRPQIALALRAPAILLVFEKFTRAYLFQIVLEIMWLPESITQRAKLLNADWSMKRVFFFLNFASWRGQNYSLAIGPQVA